MRRLDITSTMKYIIVILTLLLSIYSYAQKIESIHFHLYTDSLKKGTHNYINVDGKTSDNSWLPLTSKQIDLKTDYGTFEGNDLVLPDNPTVKKVTITAKLKTDAKNVKQITVWIKQQPDLPLNARDVDVNPRSRRSR